MGFLDGLEQLFGTEVAKLTTGQVVVRALVAYGTGLLLVRTFRALRLFGRYAAFDFVLSIILGSTLSRSINGSPHFIASLVAVFVLVLTHSLLSSASLRSRLVAGLIKGHETVLMEGGRARSESLRAAGMTEEDLSEAIRLKVPVSDPTRLDRLVMERNGGIGIVQRRPEAKVFEISVRDGVQTLRIEIG